MPYTTFLTLTNRSGAAIEVWLEPWGDVVPLAAGQSLRLVGTATAEGAFEVEAGPGGALTVWASPTASVRCYVDDVEVMADAFTLPVPAVPDGMTTSTFLRLVLPRDH